MQDKKQEVKKKRNFRLSRDRPMKMTGQKKESDKMRFRKAEDTGNIFPENKGTEQKIHRHERARWITEPIVDSPDKKVSVIAERKKKRKLKQTKLRNATVRDDLYSFHEDKPKHSDSLKERRSTNLVQDDAGIDTAGKKKHYHSKVLKERKKETRKLRYEEHGDIQNKEIPKKQDHVKTLKKDIPKKVSEPGKAESTVLQNDRASATESSGTGLSTKEIKRRKGDGNHQHRLYHEKRVSSGHLYFENRSSGQGKPQNLAGTFAGSVINRKLNEADQENAGTEAVHKSVMYGDRAIQVYKKHEFHKRKKILKQEKRLGQKQIDVAVKDAYRKYLNEHPEMNKKAMQKIRQKQLIKKQYQKAYHAGKAAKEKKEAVVKTANITTKIAKKAQDIVARNITAVITLTILMVLMLFIMAGFQSCSMMFGDSISTIVSVSYVAEPEEIEKAELYYTELEAKLQQQINQMEAAYPGLDEYRYNIAAIGHDPHTLISYLTAKYGDFTFKDVKKELEKLFELQYGVTVFSETEIRTETKTVQVGESLGNVVTSGYCNCILCCGIWSGGPTASGVMPTADHTIAVDAKKPFLPLGTKVVMNGKEYVVEDTGNFARFGVQFDVYYEDHASASAHGHQTWECFLAEGNAHSVEVSKEVTVDVLNLKLQTVFLRNLVKERMDEEETELYEQVYGCRGNLQSYETPVELNWYSYISNQYGYCINPATGKMELHRGVDINVKNGMEVRSCMNGIVILTGYDEHFGNYVVTEDEKGVQIKYAYLQDVMVTDGTAVTTDSILGTTGSTGSATGSQMYLEVVKDGEYYNPVFYITTGEGGLYGSGITYDDETVRRLFAEAELYLGMPYVWGGSSPATSFDCSGFVSYVFTNSGICNMGRLTAQGIYNICTPVMPEEAQPGDIIFFTGTYNAGEPVTHVGIYAGEGMMIHCGDPIQYASIHSAYWQSHFYAFGRPG